MNVTLSPQSEQALRALVDSGRYSSADEALEEAIAALEELHRLDLLREALAVGEAQIERGEYDDWTPELGDQITREAQRLVRQGYQPDPDVRP
jgi:putative addiction module CopG family antidote